MKEVNRIEIFKDFKNSFPKNPELDHITYFHGYNINWKDFFEKIHDKKK